MSCLWIKSILLNLIGYWNIEAVLGEGSLNLALNKPTRQSSDLHEHATSIKAVDGNFNTFGNECAHTNLAAAESPNWLLVDLEAQYDITSISVLNRHDCCVERLRNFTISVWKFDPGPHIKYNMHPNDYCVCVTHLASAPGGQLAYLPCTKICSGRFVLLVMNVQDWLNVCELRVFGNPVTECTSQYVTEIHIKEVVSKRSNTSYCPLSPHQVSTVHECSAMCLQTNNCISFNYSPYLTNTINCELATCFLHPNEDFEDDNDWSWRYFSQ